MKSIEEVLLQIVALVVDDNPEDQGTLAVHLKGIGAREVLRASGGKEAFNLLRKLPRPVDLIIADVNMPEGNGLQLLQGLRAGLIKGMRANATFVLTTDHPEVGIIQTAGALDANGFIAKPFKPEKFEAAILKACRTIFPPNSGRHAEVFVPETI